MYDIVSLQNKCKNEKCKVNFDILRVNNSISFSSYKSIASNNYCRIDGSNNCYVRKKGKSLQKGYCNKLNIKN